MVEMDLLHNLVQYFRSDSLRLLRHRHPITDVDVNAAQRRMISSTLVERSATNNETGDRNTLN
jgi:hypothetical protein